MVWSSPVSDHFTIEKEPFGQGGFRAAHKATSKSPNFDGKTYVVRRFLPKTAKLITAVDERQEDHACKFIQMQALAKNIAAQLEAKVEKNGSKDAFGRPFRYVEAYMGKIRSTNEVVTIEEYICGDFQKYVNSDGHW